MKSQHLLDPSLLPMMILEMAPYSSRLTFKQGEDLKIKDDTSIALYYVDHGGIEVSYSINETKITVAVIGSGNFIGEIGFFDGITRIRDIRAVSDTSVQIFYREHIETLRLNDPELYGRFITIITQSICGKFRNILEETEPLTAYAASLSTGGHSFVETKALPPDFFRTEEGKFSNVLVENLKTDFFEVSMKLQQNPESDIPRAVEDDFMHAMDRFFNDLEAYSETLAEAKLEDEVWGYIFKETFPYFMRSQLTERAYFKPKGYAGDYMMIEMMYKNQPVGDGKIGRLVDTWLLNRPPCRAVRGRRHFLADQLEERSRNLLKNQSSVHIMSLACGPSQELFDFIGRVDFHDKIHAICLDIDPDALQYTDQKARSFSHEAKISYLQDNLIKWALGTSTQSIIKQDVIYSGGLFDYLDNNLFLMLLKKCYETLKPGGVLIAGNFKPNSDRVFMDHLLEWRLIYRDQDDLTRLFADSPFGSDIDVLTEQEAGVQLFAIAEKKIR